MPIFEYKCGCGSAYETLSKHEDRTKTIPCECGEEAYLQSSSRVLVRDGKTVRGMQEIDGLVRESYLAAGAKERDIETLERHARDITTGLLKRGVVPTRDVKLALQARNDIAESIDA